MHGRILSAVASALALIAFSASPAAAEVIEAQPIPTTGPEPTLPAFVGAPARAKPFSSEPAWASDFMAPNPLNSVHNDPWQTDTYTQYGGPLGRSPKTLSTYFGRTCISLTFDSKGRLIGTCTHPIDGPGLYRFDPVTLDILAFRQLPFASPPPGTDPALNSTGGVYFFLDNRDRAVVATADRKIKVFKQTKRRFKLVKTLDPSGCLDPVDRMPSALPDADGMYWFVGRTEGTVGVIDPKTGRCNSIVLGEEIENSFAVASDGVYVVTDKAQYKFRAGRKLKPRTIWRSRDYGNTGVKKTGQINAGSGTTPTLFGDGAGEAPRYVAITDNADPMNVVVYKAADEAKHRVVCRVPVFREGASATENSLIAMGSSLFVENNSGYDIYKFNDVASGGIQIGGDPAAVSEPGFARIDVTAKGCRKVWENHTVRAASVVPKGDARNGLIYTYENVSDPGEPDADPWYWTALSARTGKVVFKVLAGHGGFYNNHYAGIALGRNPETNRVTAYLGGVGGVMALRDGRR